MKIDITNTYKWLAETVVKDNNKAAQDCLKALHEGTRPGNDFLGWVKLPCEITDAELSDIQATADSFKGKAEIVVVVGIGGSYLGSKAAIEALSNNFAALLPSENPRVLFAGQNLSEDYLAELIQLLDKKSYGIVVISKSGTTTEPAIAFRLLKNHLEAKVGKAAAKDLIVAITDAKRGALKTLATQEGYKTYVIPDNVGGRYSVLTPVGLLPIAIAGFDIKALVKGAQDFCKSVKPGATDAENPALVYAIARNELYKKGYTTEILASYQPNLLYITEWWKQLYGESEGKENKGIFPAGVTLTADLHSMGQYIQEGHRNLFETVLSIEGSHHELRIPSDEANLDTLNFLSDKRIDQVNKMAELGTQVAHVDGGVPNIKITLPTMDEYNLGQLFYFFEVACGISGYLLGVNPFDQPGVEAYKRNMFALLDKPGYEADSKALKARLNIK